LIIKIIVVGKTKETSLRSLERSYLERIARYTRVDLVTVRQEKSPRGCTGSRTLKAEGKRILQELQKGDYLVVLDIAGQELTSRELARFLEQHLISAARRLVFVTGGPLGLDDAVKKRADLLLSFSKLTFTHEMIRVLLLEQLYRAWTLLRGEKYHK